MNCCNDLKEALEKHKGILFNVSGGCGIDLSLGKSPCMDSDGLFFEYCPFCGRKIVRWQDKKGHFWNWAEVCTEVI